MRSDSHGPKAAKGEAHVALSCLHTVENGTGSYKVWANRWVAGLALGSLHLCLGLDYPMVANNIVLHGHLVTPERRAEKLGQKGRVIWFTGLSGSGKSTLAMAFEQSLIEAGRLAFVLDGDNVRHGLCADLGFSPAERAENLRRIGHVCALMADAGLIVLAAFVSPTREMRAQVRGCVGGDRFDEVHVSTDLSVCEARDPKGLYARARSGEIPAFTGISAPYEPPDAPSLSIDTATESLEEAIERLQRLLHRS